MNLEAIVVVVLVGLLAGWLTGLVLDGEGYGPGGDIALGVVGAIAGSVVLWMGGTAPPAGTWLGMVSAALLGAFILIFAQRTFWTVNAKATR